MPKTLIITVVCGFFLSFLATQPYAQSSSTSVATQAEEGQAASIEEKKEKKKSKKKLRWEGNFKFAFRFAKSRAKTEENRGGFELSSLNLKARYRLQKGVELRGWYQIDPLESELKEAFARLKDDETFFDRIQMGLQDRLFQLKSDLETDGLNKIATYKMRDLSLLARISFLGQFQWLLQLANGGQLDTRDISPRRVTNQDVILSDTFNQRQAFGTNSREILMGLAYNPDSSWKMMKGLELLLFFSARPVSDEDVADLNTLSDVPGFTGVNKGTTSYTKVGLNVEWKYKKWRSYSQYLNAIIRDLTRNFFSTEWQYRFAKWRPMIAYSQQTLSVSPQFTEPLSWGRQRLTLGTRYQWFEAVRLSGEYTFNGENTGGKSVNNDELMVSWVYSF